MIELIVVFLCILTVRVGVYLTDKYGPKVYTAERGSPGRKVLIIKHGRHPENDPEWIYHSSKQKETSVKGEDRCE